MLNNDYVTPADVRAWAADFGVDPNRYFTDGDDRPPFLGAWQPRVGLSYDLTGDGRHVLFGGYGRYYDRVVYNYGLDEDFRLQYCGADVSLLRRPACPIRTATRRLPGGRSILSKAGLDGIVGSGLGPTPEVFLIDNDTKPPVSDQFNAGVRTTSRAGSSSRPTTRASARVTASRSSLGTARPDGGCCLPDPRFSNLLLSERRQEELVRRALPHGRSTVRRQVGAAASPTRWAKPKRSAAICSASTTDRRGLPAPPRRQRRAEPDRRHRDRRAALRLPRQRLVTMSSGLGFTITDASQGFAFGQFERPALRAAAPITSSRYRTVDLRGSRRSSRSASNQRALGRGRRRSTSSTTRTTPATSGFIPPLPAVNPRFGEATCVVQNSTRRFQLGLRYTF